MSQLKSEKNLHTNFNSFVRCRSSQVRKLLTDKPSTAVAIMKHVFDQEYKDPRKRYLMNKYWNRKDDGLAKLLLDMGKHRARKDNRKLLNTVNTVKKKYKSLRQACHLTDISWSKFDRHSYVNTEVHKKLEYSRKLTAGQIKDIQEYYNHDDVSFPLPDKKYANKRFLHVSVSKCAKMYNMLANTTHKISTATFYKYNVKLQGCIPFRQSCCKKCQNFENVINEAAKYLCGVPHDIGSVIDRTMCHYVGYFPKLPFILRTCDHCGEAKINLLI